LLTFTLPEELRDLAHLHQRVVYDFLIRAAADSVLHLANDARFLGATPGILAVLHTWTRDLRYHPHVHLLVTGGGIAAGGEVWRKTQHATFLLPGRVLSAFFRNRIREHCQAAGLLHSTPRRVWRRRWVVHAQFAGTGEAVLDYLARYVHRVAIPNSRIDAMDEGTITFRYRNNRTGSLCRCTLPHGEFLHRFLQHVLPRGFVKVRSYGIYASSKRADLAAARELLELAKRAETPCPVANVANNVVTQAAVEGARDADPLCPSCGTGRLRVVGELDPIPATTRTPYLPRAPPTGRHGSPFVPEQRHQA
jgi:hypothetical protein